MESTALYPNDSSSSPQVPPLGRLCDVGQAGEAVRRNVTRRGHGRVEQPRLPLLPSAERLQLYSSLTARRQFTQFLKSQDEDHTPGAHAASRSSLAGPGYSRASPHSVTLLF